MGVRLALILVILVAAFLRLWKLQDIPPGIYPDEAQNATDAIQTLETRQPQAFYPANNGREGLFNNLTALSFALFGISIWSLKIVPAVAGPARTLNVTADAPGDAIKWVSTTLPCPL